MPRNQATDGEATFRQYTQSQARFYKEARGAYPQELYDVVLSHHKSSGGHTALLLDVGCGPGNATEDLAKSFTRVVGIDPGLEMINAAKEARGKTATGALIEYELAAAEDIDKLSVIEPESVDLLTGATCAHWFDMQRFWVAAEYVVKPGGTIALWAKCSLFCHPDTSSAEKVQARLFKLERETLAPYELPANRTCMNMYEDLTMPWDVHPPIRGFPRTEYVKREWDRDGVLSDGQDFFGGGRDITFAQAEHGCSTASMVTRWRQAHPDLAKTDKDCVVEAFDDIANILAPNSVRPRDVKIRMGVSNVLLMFKKRSSG